MINYLMLVVGALIGMMPSEWVLKRFFLERDLNYVRSDGVSPADMVYNVKSPPFAFMILMDAFKGVLVVLLAQWIDGWTMLPWLSLFSAALAHNFNLIKGLRNGIGIMLILGGISVLSPIIVGVYVLFLFVFNFIFKDYETMLVLSTFAIPASAIFIFDTLYQIVIGLMILIMTVTYSTAHNRAMAQRLFKKEYIKNNPFYKIKE